MLTAETIESNWTLILEIADKLGLGAVYRRYENSITLDSGRISPGLKYAPAGKGVHHDYLGGLVQHLFEMLSVSSSLGGLLAKEAAVDAPFNLCAIGAAVLLHDLHKGYLHFVQTSEGGFEYADNVTTKMFTPGQKTFAMLSEVGYNPSWEVAHILHNSEGGWAENAPAVCSVSAKYVYLLDELSVCIDRLRQNKLEHVKKELPTDWNATRQPLFWSLVGDAGGR